jgi:ferredoxin
MTMSRRDLFTWFRRPVDEPPATEPARTEPTESGGREPTADVFSLDAFYAKRDADRTIPAFAIRAAAATATTRVGVGPSLSAAHAAPGETEIVVAAATAIARDQVPAVLAHRCLATRSFCSVCVERCPVPGAIVVELGRPRVEPARCDGCGLCVLTCPAPVLAFELVPRAPKES